MKYKKNQIISNLRGTLLYALTYDLLFSFSIDMIFFRNV